jgi:hypothetical protein
MTTADLILSPVTGLPPILGSRANDLKRETILGNVSIATMDDFPHWCTGCLSWFFQYVCKPIYYDRNWMPLVNQNQLSVYVNINSIKKRMGITSNQARELLQRADNSLERFLTEAKKDLTNHVHNKARNYLVKHLGSDGTQILSAFERNETVINRLNEIKTEVERTGEAQLIFREESNLPRTLLVTPSGVYVLFNRKDSKGQGIIDKMLGQGAFKKVYKAINLNTGEKAAFCSVNIGSSNPREANEAEYYLHNDLGEITCRPVPHSLVTKRVKKDPKQSRTCYLMERMKGHLWNVISRKHMDITSQRSRIDVAKQMATLVAHFNSQGRRHRDIKPENFLYFLQNGKAVVRLADFGLATVEEKYHKHIIGTDLYSSPEALRKTAHHATEQNDGWQLGMTLAMLFFPQLDSSFIKGTKLLQFWQAARRENTKQWIADHWIKTPLRQNQWLKPPKNQNSMEYVIYKLLQIDPAQRWTPAEAAQVLARL